MTSIEERVAALEKLDRELRVIPQASMMQLIRDLMAEREARAQLTPPFTEISIDVSTSEHDSGLRAFAKMPPMEIVDGVALFEGYLNEPLEAKLNNSPPETLQADVVDYPMGAIENGRVFIDRLENEYAFEMEAGSLRMCHDWIELQRCFNYMADYIATMPPQSGWQDISSAESES